jgi:hypothetical protein
MPDSDARPLRGAPGILALALVTAAVLLGGCRGEGLSSGAVGQVVGGDAVEVAEADGWETAEPGRELADGARVRARGQPARLRLHGGETSLSPDAAVVVGPDQVDVLRGDVLVASVGTLETNWNETTVRGEGVYRVSAGVAPRVGVYRGTVDVQRVTEARQVGELRELNLSARRLPRAGEPLSYRLDDRWDRALLPHAIAFDEELERFARGLERIHGSQPREASFYDSYAALSPAAVQILARGARVSRGDAFGPPSDALVTLLMAQAAASGDDDSDLEAAAERVVTLREAGARWGLVAAEFALTPERFAAAVDAAQARHVTVSGRNGAEAVVEDGPDPAAADAD